MGDMADFTNDGWPDDECWIPDVTCKYCGKSGFEWTLTEDGWRLTTYNTGRIHRCNLQRVSTRTNA